ncbi:MAG: hypothetical protein ACEQSF_05290 [Solirubrobacteraceae bacterium]
MELKPYQQDVIKDLENYLSYLQQHNNPAKAFNAFWTDRVGAYNPLTQSGMKPYKDNNLNAVHTLCKL